MRYPVRSLLATLCLAALPLAVPVASAGVVVGISVNIAPPVLPVYEQPPCPTVGYIWTPGYWGWSNGEYYWVPGTWVAPPAVGLLWTPGYWGWSNGAYLWHAGYWGPHVGFYGGVNYGFGYTGVGFAGGEWRGGAFFYNRSVANIGALHVGFYSRDVPVVAARVSFNGGVGGIVARPSAVEVLAERDRHVAFTDLQARHEQASFHNEALRAAVNHGRPAIAATVRPGEFGGHAVMAAHEEMHGGPGPGAEHRGGPAPRAEERRGGGGGHPAAHEERREDKRH